MSKMAELHAEIVEMLDDEMPVADIARVANVPLELVVSVADDLENEWVEQAADDLESMLNEEGIE